MSLNKLRGLVDGQGGLVCWSSWGHKESDTAEQLNWTELKLAEVMEFQMSFSYPKKKMMLLKCCSQHASKFGKPVSSGHRTGKGQFFIPIPKKDNTKKCSNSGTIALISPKSKAMLKILQVSLQHTWTKNFEMYKPDLEKPEEPEIQLPVSIAS